MQYKIYTDASRRNDTGYTGVGAVLYDESGKQLACASTVVGDSKRFAVPTAGTISSELYAVNQGLLIAKNYCHQGDKLKFVIDSSSVYLILTRKINAPESLNRLLKKTRFFEAQLKKVNIEYVLQKREKNKVADALAYAALLTALRSM